jgi:ribosomal protein S18 acetylase RimI-like enzyme
MSEVTIRVAREPELPAIGELTVSAYKAENLVATDTYAAKLADARPRHREAELLVAVDDAGTVLGTVTIALPGSPWVEVGGPEDLEFRMLAVAPAARGRGVGEALTRRVLERASELGLKAVVLSSSRLMLAAHRLYERLGFVRTPEADWSPVPGVDLITYRLDLAG